MMVAMDRLSEASGLLLYVSTDSEPFQPLNEYIAISLPKNLP